MAIVAGVLAVGAILFCVLCVMSAGFFFFGHLATVGAWLMSPPLSLAEWTDSLSPFWLTVLSVGSLQFFVPVWIGLWLCIKYGKHA